ncbi:MAG TPA: nucleoside deaminase [Xanthobacteraceae bacterium]|nr:nucleoside deaminase [Xanthobacteraceae bacterium]
MQLHDAEMMRRAIDLAVRSGEEGEYPYGVVICRDGEVVADSINCVAHERDVTRHAEVVAISQAQKRLDSVSLDNCTIYVSAEPCVYCCYAIRESRIGRVVYGLSSPHMGGVSKWPVLADQDISSAMPEVFAAPPEIVAGFMAREAEEALLKASPVIGRAMKARGLFVAPQRAVAATRSRSVTMRERLMGWLRWAIFDRFGRS